MGRSRRAARGACLLQAGVSRKRAHARRLNITSRYAKLLAQPLRALRVRVTECYVWRPGLRGGCALNARWFVCVRGQLALAPQGNVVRSCLRHHRAKYSSPAPLQGAPALASAVRSHGSPQSSLRLETPCSPHVVSAGRLATRVARSRPALPPSPSAPEGGSLDQRTEDGRQKVRRASGFLSSVFRLLSSDSPLARFSRASQASERRFARAWMRVRRATYAVRALPTRRLKTKLRLPNCRAWLKMRV
mgnify:CR=1 FL=1